MKFVVYLFVFIVWGCVANEVAIVNGDGLSSRFVATGISSDEKINKFFLGIKSYIEKVDRESLSQVIAYPIKVRGGDGKQVLSINNSDDFIDNYKFIINERVAYTVACSTFDDLDGGAKGVMVGDGVIWFSEVKYSDDAPWEIKITHINNSVKDRNLWYKSENCIP